MDETADGFRAGGGFRGVSGRPVCLEFLIVLLGEGEDPELCGDNYARRANCGGGETLHVRERIAYGGAGLFYGGRGG